MCEALRAEATREVVAREQTTELTKVQSRGKKERTKEDEGSQSESIEAVTAGARLNRSWGD